MKRSVLLFALLVAAAATAWGTGLFDGLGPDVIRAVVQEAGPWGPVVFVLLFGLEGFGVPGFLFILTAIAIWPPPVAFLLCWLGAVWAGLVGFGYARSLGREWIAERLPPRVRRFEARVRERAIPTVVLIRLLFFIAAPAHWALGLSPVGVRPFLIGSALGLLPGMALLTFGGPPFVAWLAAEPLATWLALAAGVLVLAVFSRSWAKRRGAAALADD